MNRNASMFFLIVILLTLVGCATKALPTAITSTNSPITNTISSQPTSTPQVTRTTQQPIISLTPGGNQSLLFLAEGNIQKYNLQNWSYEQLFIESDGEILQADLSPDRKWLAFQDTNGLKIVEQPFTNEPTVIPEVQAEQARFLFSNNSQFLAYSDAEGLKIFNILDESSSLLAAHSTDPSDVSKLRFYSPQQWSPDNEWLWIDVSHWEGVSHVLAHIPTKTFHEYSGCYSDADWFETRKAFGATVCYSGYLGCGDEDGTYLIDLENNGQVGEKRVFQEIVPAEASQREARDIALNPGSEQIVFVQLSRPGQMNQLSRLMLIDVLNGEHKELDSSEGDITSPVWATDGEKLFYTVQRKKESQVISLDLDSGEKAMLSSLPNRAVLFSELIGNEWLLAGTIINRNWDSLYLVNIYSGGVVKVSALGYDDNVKPFLGVLLSP